MLTPALLMFAVAVSTVPAPSLSPHPVAAPDLKRLPPPTRAALHRHAPHFARLSNGMLVDRQNELALRRLAKDGAERPRNETEARARGLLGSSVTPPPIWTCKARVQLDPIIPGVADGPHMIRVTQALPDGEALVEFEWVFQYGKQEPQVIRKDARLRDIPGNYADGGNLTYRTDFALLPDEPAKFTYTTVLGGSRTVSSYVYVTIAQDGLTPEELAAAVADGEAELIEWSFRKDRTGKIEWNRRRIDLKGLEPNLGTPASPSAP
jgi:hypothetical protein